MHAQLMAKGLQQTRNAFAFTQQFVYTRTTAERHTNGQHSHTHARFPIRTCDVCLCVYVACDSNTPKTENCHKNAHAKFPRNLWHCEAASCPITTTHRLYDCLPPFFSAFLGWCAIRRVHFFAVLQIIDIPKQHANIQRY